MNTSRRYLLLGIIVSVIVLAIAYRYYAPKSISFNGAAPTPEAELNFENEIDKTPIDPSFSADSEILFTKNLVVMSRTISIDGGDFKRVPCAGKNGKPQLIGYIKEKETRLELVCINDFLGGISLQYQEGSGKKIHLNLGRNEGDAGDLWDTRSMISKTDEKILHIDSITLTSSQDLADAEQPEDIPPPDCEQQQVAFAWDPQKNTFIETIPSKNFLVTQFKLPIEIDEGCLTSGGQWPQE